MAYKHVSNMRDLNPRTRPRARHSRWLFLTTLLLISPLVYECGLICHGNWQSMLGSHHRAATPLLDMLSDSVRVGRFQTSRWLQATVRTGRWDPSMAIPLTITCACLGVLLLRKGHRAQ